MSGEEDPDTPLTSNYEDTLLLLSIPIIATGLVIVTRIVQCGVRARRKRTARRESMGTSLAASQMQVVEEAADEQLRQITVIKFGMDPNELDRSVLAKTVSVGSQLSAAASAGTPSASDAYYHQTIGPTTPMERARQLRLLAAASSRRAMRHSVCSDAPSVKVEATDGPRSKKPLKEAFSLPPGRGSIIREESIDLSA